MDKKEAVWIQFAAAALAKVVSPDGVIIAANVADRMLGQWSARFGDAAFLLEGQTECATCHKPLAPGSEWTPSTDGVKFCNVECLKASGREE